MGKHQVRDGKGNLVFEEEVPDPEPTPREIALAKLEAALAAKDVCAVVKAVEELLK